MVLAISDSDVLIHLSKLDLLFLLKLQFSQIFISQTVYDETVIQGVKSDKKDALILKNFMKKDLIKVKKISEQITKRYINKYQIHKGESSMIGLAKKYQAVYCFTNEIKVRRVLKREGLRAVGTLGIILKARGLNNINK
ncbi:MAG: hypothetical protein ACOC35_15540, partial [Promethearchaeia archaeon]